MYLRKLLLFPYQSAQGTANDSSAWLFLPDLYFIAWSQSRSEKKEKKKVNQDRSNFTTSKVIFSCEKLNLSWSTFQFFDRKLVLAGMKKRSKETTDPEESQGLKFEVGHVKVKKHRLL